MKRILTSLVAVLFLAAVAGPVLADNAKAMATPTAKSMKHKKSGHKVKKSKKMKASSTPTAK